MPRVTRARAQANREAVVRVASELLREHGVGGVSVDAVCTRAGLTHGGFYKQFASKDALLSEAMNFTVDQRRKVVAETTEQHGDGARALLTNWYLSPEHRDAPTSGCAVAALVGEAATNAHGPLRDGYRTALDDLLCAVATHDGDASGHVGDADLAKVALMVGALQLARATAGTPLSEQFLAAAFTHLQT